MIQASIELKLYLALIATILLPVSTWAITWARYFAANEWNRRTGQPKCKYQYTNPFDPHWRGYTFIGLCLLWGLILG